MSDALGRAAADDLRFDEYRLVRPLGKEASGRVWLAHDWLLDRPVVVRFVEGAPGDSAPSVVSAREGARCLAGARAMARVTDRSVCQVRRVVETRERQYVVTDYARGALLSEVPLPLAQAQAQEVALALCQAVAARSAPRLLTNGSLVRSGRASQPSWPSCSAE
ncbi:MAG: hypothetical protein V2A73_02640 [Pseudomonadota bacterium]